ncbi:hypothetical protein [uncultured Pedobacter sp.]|uniref:hypothetical protein n=1 Tax=uncultured Pedobacter sp. TaxID=246139 RepID=UPI0025D35980|nr:hypothetical protein [uncultured Pedobacter sp.]
MKKILILCLAICMFSSCYAQQIIRAGIYEFNGKRFKVKDLDFKSYNGKNIIIIGNPDYKYQNTPPPLPKVEHPFPMQKKDIQINNDKIRKIIFDVLKENLEKLKKNDENISLSFDLSQNGQILSIGYSLNQKTFISIEDIAEIDKRIKDEIKVNFTGTDYLQYDVISYSMPTILFSKIEL